MEVNTETLISVAIVLFSAIMARLESLNRRVSRLEGKVVILCDMLRQTNKKKDR